jgi:hypothetical protein
MLGRVPLFVSMTDIRQCVCAMVCVRRAGVVVWSCGRVRVCACARVRVCACARRCARMVVWSYGRMVVWSCGECGLVIAIVFVSVCVWGLKPWCGGVVVWWCGEAVV